MFSFQNTPSKVLGVDIYDGLLSMVQLRDATKHYEVQSYRTQELPINIRDTWYTAENLPYFLRLFREARAHVRGKKITTKKVRFSLPLAMTEFHSIEVPDALALENRQDFLKKELQVRTSMQKESFDFHYRLLDRSLISTNHPDKTALVSVFPADFRRRLEHGLAEDGLELIDMESRPLAATRVLGLNHSIEEKTVFGVNFGMYRSHVYFVVQGVLVSFVRIPVAREMFLDALMKGFNISREKALSLYDMQGVGVGAPDDTLFTVLQPVLANFVESLQLYQKKFLEILPGVDRMDQVFLSGNGAYMKGLDRYMTKQLGLSVERVDPWKHIYFPSKVPTLSTKQSSHYLGSLGLALKYMQVK